MFFLCPGIQRGRDALRTSTCLPEIEGLAALAPPESGVIFIHGVAASQACTALLVIQPSGQCVPLANDVRQRALEASQQEG